MASGFPSLVCALLLPAIAGQAQVFLKTTGNPVLDQKMNSESALINSLFEVSTDMYVIDDGAVPNAYANCESSNPTIFHGSTLYGVNLLVRELWTRGELALVGIMAHETGHIIQCKNRSQDDRKIREMQADYLAGFYLGRRSSVTPTDIAPFFNSLWEGGARDYFTGMYYGTPQQRTALLIEGVKDKALSIGAAADRGRRLGYGLIYPNNRTITLTTPCGHSAHPNGDIYPCQHPAHLGGDVIPCQHTCIDPFGFFVPCHVGDLIPCQHPLHFAGDVGACMHLLHPTGHSESFQNPWFEIARIAEKSDWKDRVKVSLKSSGVISIEGYPGPRPSVRIVDMTGRVYDVSKSIVGRNSNFEVDHKDRRFNAGHYVLEIGSQSPFRSKIYLTQ